MICPRQAQLRAACFKSKLEFKLFSSPVLTKQFSSTILLLAISTNRSMLYIQYRSEISSLHTRKTHAQLLHKRVLKNPCSNTQVCARSTHLMYVFPFVIHSHNAALCGILLHNKKQDKRQFLQTPLKNNYLCRETNSRFARCWCTVANH